jgi:hypothetical protein
LYAAAAAAVAIQPSLQDSRITIDGIIRHPWFSKRLPQK